MGSNLNKDEFVVSGELNTENGTINIHHYKLVKRLVGKLKGHTLEISFKRLKYMKSVAQLRWLWGVCYMIILKFLKNTQGVTYTKNQIHEYTTQYILNDGKDDPCIVFKDAEFKLFVEDFITLVSKSKDIAATKVVVHKFVNDLRCNIQVDDVLGERVVMKPNYKRVSALTIAQFSQMKKDIQKHWDELGCVIPDPISKTNNLLTDFKEFLEDK